MTRLSLASMAQILSALGLMERPSDTALIVPRFQRISSTTMKHPLAWTKHGWGMSTLSPFFHPPPPRPIARGGLDRNSVVRFRSSAQEVRADFQSICTRGCARNKEFRLVIITLFDPSLPSIPIFFPTHLSQVCVVQAEQRE